MFLHFYNADCRGRFFSQTSVCLFYAPQPPEIPVHPPKGGLVRESAHQPALMLLRQESDKRRPATTSRPLLSVPAPHLIRLGFPYSDLRKSLFKIGDQIVGVFQADGQSNQIGGHLKRGTCHGGVGHGARMAYARNRPRHIRRCLVHVLSSGWPKILSPSTSINHVMFVFSKADNNSFACTGN